MRYDTLDMPKAKDFIRQVLGEDYSFDQTDKVLGGAKMNWDNHRGVVIFYLATDQSISVRMGEFIADEEHPKGAIPLHGSVQEIKLFPTRSPGVSIPALSDYLHLFLAGR